jgi:L-arabinonolactonase
LPDIRECVPCANKLGEGPLWDVDEQRLYWVDGLANEIWRCAADGSELRTWALPANIGSMTLRAGGGAVVAIETGLHFFDFNTGALDFIAHPEAGLDGVRLNDGAVDSRGRFIVGSLDMAMVYPSPERPAPRGSLYRLERDLSLHRLETGVAISNGPCWSPDQATFYFTDSGLDTIFAYDWDEDRGVPTGKRPFAKLARYEIPDGGAVDAEGYVWTATNGSFSGIGEVRRFAPDGSLDRTIQMPTAKTTSLTFGGPNLDILYVTTMKMPSPIADTPADGKLFAIHGLGVRGQPERRFAG